MDTNIKKLHPLTAAAAVSLIVFSAVGVAAITGLIPTSKGSIKEEAPITAAAIETPPAPVKPRPVKKHVVKALPAPAQALAPVAYNEFPPTPVAQAPAVKPGRLGTVQSVRQVEKAGDAKGVGVVGGGVAGAVLGHQIGEHNKLVTILGAAGGALLGNHIEKQARGTKTWELAVRYDDGTSQVFSSEAQPFWHQGDRVRLLEGKLQPV